MCPEIDIHQHLWPEPLLSALSLRREPPMLVRRGAGWALALRGEPEAPVDLADHDPDAPRGARPRRRPGPRARRPVHAARDRSAPRRRGRGAARGLPRGRARAARRVRRLGRGRTRRPRSRRAGAAARRGLRRRLHRRRGARRPRRLRAAGPGARDARAPRRPAARPSRPRAGDATAGLPDWWAALTGYVADDADGVARVRRLGPRGAPGPARVLRDARRPGAAAARAPARARRPARSATRASSSTSPPTARAPSMRSCARSASTGSSTARDRPVVPAAELPLGDAVRHALRRRNPARAALHRRHGGPRMTTLPRNTALQRDLDAGELRELVGRIAADPGQWRPLVRSDTPAAPLRAALARRPRRRLGHHLGQRQRHRLPRPRRLARRRRRRTGRAHRGAPRGGRAAAPAAPPPRRDVRLRRVPRAPDAPGRHGALAVSIHAYSPPLWRMGAYEVDADGTLRRRSISSAEELRPVESAA